jgi:hypothetical protein
MPYIEKQLLSISLMTNFNLEINNQDNDNSIATLTFIKYSASFNVLETRIVTITGKEVRESIPDIGKTLTYLANTYNAFDPDRQLPLSEIVEEESLP